MIDDNDDEEEMVHKGGLPLLIRSTRPSDQEPVWQVVGVVGIDLVSDAIIFDCQKKSSSSRVAMGYWSSRGRVDQEMIPSSCRAWSGNFCDRDDELI